MCSYNSVRIQELTMSFKQGIRYTSWEPKINGQIKKIFNLNEGENFSTNVGKLDSTEKN